MKALPHFSLRYYLALSYTFLVFVGLISTGFYWFAEQKTSAEEALLVQLKEQARLFSILLEVLGKPDVTGNLPAPLTAMSTNLKIVYITPDMNVRRVSDLDLNDYEMKTVLDLAPEVMSGQSITRETHESSESLEEILYAASPVYDTNNRVTGAVCLVLPLTEFRETIIDLRNQLIGFAAVLGFLSLVLGIVLAAAFTRPLSQAGRMSAQIASGDYSVRVARKGPKELVELADNFNHMAGELDRQAELRNQVLANVTHELARPLGALKLGVDSLRNDGIDDKEFAKDLLEDMSCTLQNMEALVEDLAVAARPTDVPVSLHLQPVDVNAFMHGVFSRYQKQTEKQNLQLHLDLPDELSRILADEDRLNQIIGNLIDNSLKFTRSGGRITLSVRRNDPWVELIVEDTGPGIPDDQLGSIFTPYLRGRNVHTISEGMGLGLSIVKQLVEAHHGEVELKNIPSGGLQAVVRLPILHE